MRRFSILNNIGRAKYIVSFHDGQKRHKDNSSFFDIAIFKNKKTLEDFTKKLNSKGYKEI